MPAQAGDGLAEVYRVARILDLLFRDIRNEGCGFSKDFEDTACHAQFGALTLSPEQIDRPGLSLDESGDHSPAMIVDMDPVTDLCSLASDVNRLLIKGGLDKGRHQLFRVLAGPVVAAGTGDDDILSVGAGRRETEEVGRGFRGCVWGRRIEWVDLHRTVGGGYLPVDLAGRTLKKGNAGAEACFH